MSSNTSPDNITYPVSGDSVAPLETVFANMATSIQTALNTRAVKSYKPADFTALAALTGMTSGDMATVVAGSVDMAYNGSAWVQQTVGIFATTTARDTEYAKASAVYKAAYTAQALDISTGYVSQWNGSAWVVSSPAGLVPIIPTITANTGVSVSASGTVTLAAATSASLNGVFTSTYDNYLILIDFPTHSTGSISEMRFRLAGTDDTTASSYQSQITTSSTTTVAGAQVVTTYAPLNNNGAFIEDSMKVTVYGPAIARVTRWQSDFFGVISSITSGFSYGRHTVATAWDGFTVLASTGTLTGTIRVYGYSK